MTTHKEALTLALEALEYEKGANNPLDWHHDKAITAIEEALAQPEQEPVAWQVEVLIQGVWSPMGNPQRDKDRAEKLAANPSIPKECQRVIELYTTPPQRTWVGLTEEEIDDIWRTHLHRDSRVQAIEAKLKEKNMNIFLIKGNNDA